ncbi:50S ribosomal protein L11 methyltransferase [Rhodobium gokarnense]|uniref:Ribosomal protein L11 methyltransferase n=1 Tax=Rhodobium gokarnense TaxID=364296 RepID=A0ABT3H9E1_9HYPH|nr:50S ribosomal protein L11 methyltransferase [Rhodobium gokarnense]MCW2307018.1 ribosomal protein L11 methyltransferase [Rhodobium gokarnense]
MFRAVAYLSEPEARMLSAIFMEDETSGALASAALEESETRWFCEVLFDEAPDAATLDAYARDMTGLEASFEVMALPDIDWVAKSLEGLTAVTAGRFVVHGAHERAAVPANAVGIEIEAGQAFGTGHHATTWGCLSAIDRLTRKRAYKHPLDLGCGSGVLAIGLARVLRGKVLASDIDPLAVRVARGNARLNGVSAFVTTVVAGGMQHRAIAGAAPFDLIVANILARPLRALAFDIARAMSPGGDLILSGLQLGDVRRIHATYRAAGFSRIAEIRRDGWATLILRFG